MGMSMVMRRMGMGWGFRSVGVGQGCGKGEAGFIVSQAIKREHYTNCFMLHLNFVV